MASISVHSRRHLIQPPELNVPLVGLGHEACGKTTAVKAVYLPVLNELVFIIIGLNPYNNK